jgi:hypothetical protein
MSDPVTPSRIMEVGQGFMASKTLLSAVELGVFTALAESGPQDAAALHHRLKLHKRSVCDFLDALVALGFLTRDAEDRYANTPETDLYLDRHKPTYVGGMLEMMNARLYGFWGALTEALRTGELQNEAKGGGKGLFEALYADPARLEAFLKAMTGISLLTAKAIASKFPWRDYKTMVDIGCAQGCLPVQVALAHPHIAGGGFDLPTVRPIFERYVRENGLGDRLRFYPGSFFTDPLPAVDVLVMGHILHDWDLDEKKMLLRTAWEALQPGGAILVYDMIIDDERRTNLPGLLMSLNMLIETRGGFDYTGAECVSWMKETGFREARAESLAGPHSMVVAIK